MPNPYQQGLWQLAPVRNPGAVAFMVSDLFSAFLDQEARAEAGPRAGDATAGTAPAPGTPAAPGTVGEDAQLQGLSAFASEHLEGLGRCQRRRKDRAAAGWLCKTCPGRKWKITDRGRLKLISEQGSHA